MEIRILRATGALTDLTGRLLFPMAGDVIAVSGDQADSMVSAEHAEYVNPVPVNTDKDQSEQKPKAARARKPKRTTVAEGPQETR